MEKGRLMKGQKASIRTVGKCDELRQDEECLIFLFDLVQLEATAKSAVYTGPVVQALFTGFGELIQAGVKELTGSDFPVYWGDVGNHFAVGVSTSAPQDALEILRTELVRVTGWATHGGGIANRYGLIPCCRFQKGKVVLYETGPQKPKGGYDGMKFVSRRRRMLPLG